MCGVRRLAGVAVGDENLDRAGAVANGREARLSHHALQQDAARDCHLDRARFERGAVEFAVAGLEVGGEMLAPEVVGERIAGLP